MIQQVNDEQMMTYNDHAGSITHYRAIGWIARYLEQDCWSLGWYNIVYDTNTRRLAGTKPMGVLEEIQSLNRTVWERESVGLQLIALMLSFLVLGNNVELPRKTL